MHGILFFRLEKSPRTSIGFHKRLKITRERNKTRDQRPRLGTKVCKHQNGIKNANVDLKIGSHVHNRAFLKCLKKFIMTFDFLLITCTNTGPCHAFYTPDQFSRY